MRWPQLRRDSLPHVALCLLFVGALAVRAPELLAHPRFWAEEGRYYYANLQEGTWRNALTLVIRGNYQILLNLSAYLASFVPARLAAHVTTGISLAVACVPVWLLSVLGRQQAWRWWTLAAAAVLLAWLPTGYEVFLTATNLQWVCSLSILLAASLDANLLTGRANRALTGWVCVCALVGVPSAMLAPLFAIRGAMLKSRWHLLWAAILGVGALVQLAIIVTHSHVDRAFTVDPFLLLLPMLVQSVVSPTVGVGRTEALLAFMRASPHPLLLVTLFAGVVVSVALLVGQLKQPRASANLAMLWVGTAIIVSLLNVFGSIGEPDHLVSSWSGGRYFLLANLCWILLLLACANLPAGLRRLPALGLIAAGVVSGYQEMRTGTWKDFLVHGTAWSQTVHACAGIRPCEVQVWPGGADWTFVLKRR